MTNPSRQVQFNRRVLLAIGWVIMICGCADDNPTQPGTGAEGLYDSIWPAAVGNFWVFELESQEFVSDNTYYDRLADVPPIPSMENLYTDLQEADTEPLSAPLVGTLRWDIVSDASTDPDTVTFIVKSGIESAAPFAPFCLKMGSSWQHSEDRIASCGNGYLTWVHLSGPLIPGREFTANLASQLADDMVLKGRVWSILSHSVLGQTYPNCVEYFYLLDMGIQAGTDENSQVTGYTRSYIYGVVVYAPGVGPVYSKEKFLGNPYGPYEYGILRTLTGVLNEHGSNPVVPIDTEAQVVDVWGTFGAGNGQFNIPVGISLDATGDIYVVDAGNIRVQKFSNEGVFIDTWGHSECSTDLDGGMSWPGNIVFNQAGNLLVTDNASLCGVLLVHEFTTDGLELAEHRVAMIRDGSGTIGGLAEAPDGSIALAIENRFVRYTSDMKFVAYGGGQGSAPGEFVVPRCVAIAADGATYVADSSLGRITKLNEEGGFVLMWGTLGADAGEFDRPLGLAVDTTGRVYVADTGNDRIQVFDADGQFVAQLGPELSSGGSLDGPLGLAFAPGGDLLVVDLNNNRVVRMEGVD